MSRYNDAGKEWVKLFTNLLLSPLWYLVVLLISIGVLIAIPIELLYYTLTGKTYFSYLNGESVVDIEINI